MQHQQETQFKAPGSIEVAVREPGRYYLWNDFRTVYNGRSYNRSKSIPDGIEIQIRDANGHKLQFVSDTSISMSSNGSAKKSIGYVEVEEPGEMKVEVTGGSEDMIFSFAQSGLLRIFGLLIGGVGLSGVVTITGLGLIVWGIVKLGRANRNTASKAGSAM